MGRSFRIGVFVAGSILLGPSVFFAALAQDDLQKSPDGVLGEAVVFAEALRSNESISKDEYKAWCARRCRMPSRVACRLQEPSI